MSKTCFFLNINLRFVETEKGEVRLLKIINIASNKWKSTKLIFDASFNCGHLSMIFKRHVGIIGL